MIWGGACVDEVARALVEEGTHDELVGHGEKYARMFMLQAEGYR
jgi:hypothetical protein